MRRYCQLAGGGGTLCRHAHSLLFCSSSICKQQLLQQHFSDNDDVMYDGVIVRLTRLKPSRRYTASARTSRRTATGTARLTDPLRSEISRPNVVYAGPPRLRLEHRGPEMHPRRSLYSAGTDKRPVVVAADADSPGTGGRDRSGPTVRPSGRPAPNYCI